MIAVPAPQSKRHVTGLTTAIGREMWGYMYAGRGYRINTRLAVNIDTQLSLTLTFFANDLDINVEQTPSIPNGFGVQPILLLKDIVIPKLYGEPAGRVWRPAALSSTVRSDTAGTSLSRCENAKKSRF